MASGYGKFSEDFDLLDVINPQSTSTQVNGTWVSVRDYPRFIAKCNIGAIASTGTFTFQIRHAVDGSGTSAKALKASAALADTDDNEQLWLEVRAEELDVDGGFDYVRIEAVAATAASIISAELLGYGARYAPVAQPATLTVS